MKKPTLAIAALAIAAIGLAGCAAGGANPEPSKSAEAPALPNTGWERADYSAVADGGTLNLPVDDTPLNFQGLNVDSGTVDDAFLATIYLPAFVQFAEDGSWTANPDYAESVELTKDDPQTVELKINPKAVWSDGTPISVADLAATWNASKDSGSEFAPIADNVWKDIESIEPGDNDQHAIITFKNVNADWPSIFGAGGVYPAWAVDTPEHFNTSWANGPFAADGTTFVSGGPFIVTSYDQNGRVLTFGRNPAWWGQTPKLETIIAKAVSRNGLAQAFANKEIDAFDLHGSADNFATVEGRDDAVVQRSLGPVYRHVTLNGTSDVFKDVEVRQAFAKSLQREQLAQAILGGVESPITLLNNLVYLPGQDGYEDHAGSLLDGNVDDAKKILEDAGYKFDDKGMASKGGKALEVRFVIPSENTNSANIAKLVQAQTKKAGFDVKIDVVESDAFFDKYINTEDRDFDATYFAWQGTAFPVSSTESIFYPADSGQNYPGITDDSLGKDWPAANAELDSDKRIDLANKIDQKIVDLVGTIPLFPEPYTFGVVDNLVNYGPSLFETVKWETVGYKS